MSNESISDFVALNFVFIVFLNQIDGVLDLYIRHLYTLCLKPGFQYIKPLDFVYVGREFIILLVIVYSKT